MALALRCYDYSWHYRTSFPRTASWCCQCEFRPTQTATYLIVAVRLHLRFMKSNSRRWSPVVEEVRYGQDGPDGESNSTKLFVPLLRNVLDRKGISWLFELKWDGKYLLSNANTRLPCLRCKQLFPKFTDMAPCSLVPGPTATARVPLFPASGYTTGP